MRVGAHLGTGPAMRIGFPLPCQPWSVNEVPASVRAKIRRSKDKQAWRDAAYYAGHQALRDQRVHIIGADAWVPGMPSTVQLVIPFRVRRVRDPHNYVGTVVKAVVDGLKLAKFWPDDSPEFVTVLEPILVVNPDERVYVDVLPRQG